MAKAKSALRRAAALLAALCLAASMTLPVYAEGAEAADTPAIVEQADAPTEETTAAETPAPEEAPAETAAPTKTPQTEEPTPEPTAEPTAEPIITPESTAEPTAEPTITPEITAESTSTPKPTHTPEPTVTPTPDEDAADDADEVEPAFVKQIKQISQINDYSAMYSAEESIPDSCTLYLAVNTKNYNDWKDKSGFNMKVCIQKAVSGNKESILPMQDTNRTMNGQKIYSVTLSKNRDYYEDGKVYRILFQYFEGNHWGAQDLGLGDGGEVSDANACQSITKYAGMLYDGDKKVWKHFSLATIYAGQEMQFQNKTDTELQNVTACFYTKDENGEYQSVGTEQSIGNVAANTTVRGKITIPEGNCAYVQFKAGDEVLGKTYYNFYNEGEEDATVGKFAYKAGETSCFTYNGAGEAPTWGVPGTSAGDVRVYFDASLSHLAYTAVDEIDASQNSKLTTNYGMPGDGADQQLHCWIAKDENDTEGKQLPLNKYTPATTTTASSRELWYVDIPEGYNYINFAAGNVSGINDIHGNGITTGTLIIPDDYNEPCFFADSSDDVIYKQNQPRGGYWGKKDSVRNAAEGKKWPPVVDITQQPFQNISGVKYISSTLYDYYTDYELNGNNRDDYGPVDHDKPFKQQRNWVTFRQFDRTISDYYSAAAATNKPNYPIYTGHFQSDEAKDWPLFSNLAGTLNLYGWDYKGSNDNVAYRKFMATNNSNLDAQPSGNGSGKYDYTMLGLVADQLSGGTANGNLIMSGTTDLLEPHFNEAFLKGDNSRNAKIGEVYHNVLFPFTKNENVFDDQPGVEYWWFDSSKTSLYMRQDPDTKGYYLGNASTDKGETSANHTDNRSQNVNAISKTDYNITTQYGFFPFNEFNETTTETSAEKYNYGFGAKLVIPFSLTADGQVQNKQGDSKPIRFYFSGDDDVWVYIDGQLALDIGGAHGKVSGFLDFGQMDGRGANTVKAYVSKVKDNGDGKTYDSGDQTTLTYGGTSTNYYYSTSVNIPNLTTGTHTLTMFYMERGMWESNMAVAYNFPDYNELQVEKKVDYTEVNPLFHEFFAQNERKLFSVNIRNQATHYGTKTLDGATPTREPVKVTDFTPSRLLNGQDCSTNYLGRGDPPGDSSDNATTVHWYASSDDTGGNASGRTSGCSQYRYARYGQIVLNQAQNIKDMDYLTFQVYVDDDGTQSMSVTTDNLYLQLVDSSGKVVGCGTTTPTKAQTESSYLEGKTTVSQTFASKTWCTVKVRLNALDGGKLDDVKKILIGDDLQRHIYFRDFTFTQGVSVGKKTGFTTKQYEIPDYGSAESGKLEYPTGAQYTSNKAAGTTFAIDSDGQFELANNELVSFKDQFRRGSYISLKEIVNSDLFTTTWQIYENDRLVKNGDGTEPFDQRTEPYLSGSDADSQEQSNRGYATAAIPTKADNTQENTIVFKSYADESDETQFTKLKVRFTNKVNTGRLVIVKQVPDDERDKWANEEFTFNVTFTNIGGLGGTETVSTTVTVKPGQAEGAAIENIPVGTEFTITEQPKDGFSLKEITIAPNGRVSGATARGTIVQAVGADSLYNVVTYTNTARKLIDLTVEKKWEGADGTSLTDGLPDSIWIQLQRRYADDEDENQNPWQDMPKTAWQLHPDYDGNWTHTFTGLDQYELGASTEGKRYYEYRVVESANRTDFFETGGTIVLTTPGTGENGTDYKYEVRVDSLKIDENTGSAETITITNQRQKPKYQLVITKQGIDGESDPVLLGGVEFTLEKLDENKEYRQVSVNKTTGGDGKCSFAGLEPGSYRLTEVKTAEGYNLLAEPIEFVLTEDGHCTANDATLGEVSGGGAAGYTIALTINNRKGLTLPHTGADAPSLWVLIGLPLLVAGLLVLVFRYNRKGGKRS